MTTGTPTRALENPCKCFTVQRTRDNSTNIARAELPTSQTCWDPESSLAVSLLSYKGASSFAQVSASKCAKIIIHAWQAVPPPPSPPSPKLVQSSELTPARRLLKVLGHTASQCVMFLEVASCTVCPVLRCSRSAAFKTVNTS